MISTVTVERRSAPNIEPRKHRQSRFPWIAEALGWLRGAKPEATPSSTERHASLGLSTSERNILNAMRQARLSQPSSNFMERRAEQLRQFTDQRRVGQAIVARSTEATVAAPTDGSLDELVAEIHAAYYRTTPTAQ